MTISGSEDSAIQLSLDAVADLPQCRLDILLRVYHYFRRLEGLHRHLLWGIHEPSLGEGHERTHLPKIYAYPLLEAVANNLSEGNQSRPNICSRECTALANALLHVLYAQLLSLHRIGIVECPTRPTALLGYLALNFKCHHRAIAFLIRDTPPAEPLPASLVKYRLVSTVNSTITYDRR